MDSQHLLWAARYIDVVCDSFFSCNSLSSAEEIDFVFLYIIQLVDCFSLEIDFSAFDLTLFLWL